MTRLSKKQKAVLQRIYSGEKLYYAAYSPGIHLKAHCYWEGDHSPFGDNSVVTVRALINRGYVEIVHTEPRCRDGIICLTSKGSWAASGTPINNSEV